MSRPIFRTALTVSIWTVFLFSRTAEATEPEPAALTIRVENVSSQGGFVRVALYDKSNYEGRDTSPIIATTVEARAPVTIVKLPAVRPGEHAIKMFQDYYRTGSFVTSALRIPEEPFGFSNDARPDSISPASLRRNSRLQAARTKSRYIFKPPFEHVLDVTNVKERAEWERHPKVKNGERGTDFVGEKPRTPSCVSDLLDLARADHGLRAGRNLRSWILLFLRRLLSSRSSLSRQVQIRNSQLGSQPLEAGHCERNTSMSALGRKRTWAHLVGTASASRRADQARRRTCPDWAFPEALLCQKL